MERLSQHYVDQQPSFAVGYGRGGSLKDHCVVTERRNLHVTTSQYEVEGRTVCRTLHKVLLESDTVNSLLTKQ